MNTNTISKTTHLDHLTDKFGVWQFFENGEILRSEGYALDDSSRALIVYLLYNNHDSARICLDYIERSLKDGLFVGFWNESHEAIVYPSSEDAHALAVWALSFAVKHNFEKAKAQQLLSRIDLELIENSQYIRTRAYALISHSLRGNHQQASSLAESLIKEYKLELKWFENTLTYANAIIPYALLLYLDLQPENSKEVEDIIIESIKTLEEYCRIGVIPAPVGSRQWQKIGDISRDIYGQQPIDAAFMVLLLCKANDYFKKPNFKKAAQEWMDWFYGNNIMKTNLITLDFACSDWIKEQGVSTNYGSESTIVYLWAQKVFNQLHE